MLVINFRLGAGFVINKIKLHRTFYNTHRYKETPVGNSQIKTDENPHLKQIFQTFLT